MKPSSFPAAARSMACRARFDYRRSSVGSAQPLRGIEGGRRSPLESRCGARPAVGFHALFQRCWRGLGAEICEAHTPETHLLPLAVDAALGLGPELTLLGDDYENPRWFVHPGLRPCDRSGGCSCSGARVAVEKNTRRPPRGLQPCSGSGYSVKQALRQTATVAGRRVPHQVGPRRPGDSSRLVGNIGKAQSVLGWRPSRDLTLQIEDTLRWCRRMQR